MWHFNFLHLLLFFLYFLCPAFGYYQNQEYPEAVWKPGELTSSKRYSQAEFAKRYERLTSSQTQQYVESDVMQEVKDTRVQAAHDLIQTQVCNLGACR